MPKTRITIIFGFQLIPTQGGPQMVPQSFSGYALDKEHVRTIKEAWKNRHVENSASEITLPATKEELQEAGSGILEAETLLDLKSAKCLLIKEETDLSIVTDNVRNIADKRIQ